MGLIGCLSSKYIKGKDKLNVVDATKIKFSVVYVSTKVTGIENV